MRHTAADDCEGGNTPAAAALQPCLDDPWQTAGLGRRGVDPFDACSASATAVATALVGHQYEPSELAYPANGLELEIVDAMLASGSHAGVLPGVRLNPGMRQYRMRLGKWLG